MKAYQGIYVLIFFGKLKFILWLVFLPRVTFMNIAWTSVAAAGLSVFLMAHTKWTRTQGKIGGETIHFFLMEVFILLKLISLLRMHLFRILLLYIRSEYSEKRNGNIFCQHSSWPTATVLVLTRTKQTTSWNDRFGPGQITHLRVHTIKCAAVRSLRGLLLITNSNFSRFSWQFVEKLLVVRLETSKLHGTVIHWGHYFSSCFSNDHISLEWLPPRPCS